MAENNRQQEAEKCVATRPECGADVVFCEEDPKHSGKHTCEKGHEWT